MTDDNSKERTKSSSSSSSQKRTDEDYGYYFYPDRGGRRDKSLVAKVAEGRSSNRAMKCITNVYWCAEKRKRHVIHYLAICVFFSVYKAKLS